MLGGLGAGCGVVGIPSAAQASASPPPAGVGSGWTASAVAFGATNPTTPSLLRLADGSLALAYGTDHLGDRHLYFTQSADGSSWSSPQAITSGGLSDEDPALLQDASGEFHVVFASNRSGTGWLLYETALQGGTWSAPQALSLPGGMQQSPAITRTSSGWALAYQSADGLEIAQSTDGATWSPAGEVGTLLDAPAIAALGSRLVVVAERSDQLFEVDRDSSGHWTGPTQLALGGGSAWQPALATDSDGDLTLAFATRSSSSAPWGLAISSFTGTAWSAPTAVAAADYDDTDPSLQLDSDGRPQVAWGIYRSDGTRGIFLALAAAADHKAPKTVPSIPPSGSGQSSQR